MEGRSGLICLRRNLVPALLVLFLLPLGRAQNASKPIPAPDPAKAANPLTSPANPTTPSGGATVTPRSSSPPALGQAVTTRTFDLKYADPERLREIFAGRSFIIEANRDLKVITAHGTPEFLKEVEDTVKRFDVAPPPPANLQITIYLLTTAAQAPTGRALPAELASLGKELSPAGAQPLRLADSQVIRLREGQSGEETSAPGAPDSAGLLRIRLKEVNVIPGKKGDLVSINGLQVWVNIPAVAGSTGSQARTDSDVSSDIDVEPNEATLVSKAGVDKPVVVIVRAAVIR